MGTQNDNNRTAQASVHRGIKSKNARTQEIKMVGCGISIVPSPTPNNNNDNNNNSRRLVIVIYVD